MKLWVDDIRRPPNEVEWLWARTNQDAILHLLLAERHGEPFSEASLDHDLGLHGHDPDEPDADLRVPPDDWRFEDGVDLVTAMIALHLVPPKVAVHSHNPPGADRMAGLLEQHCAVTVKPFAR